MKLRTWLLLSFISFALLIVVLFGAITYQIAIDNQVDKEIGLLQHSLKDQAAAMAAQHGAIRWKDWLHTAEPVEDIFLVLSKSESGGLRPAMSSTRTIPPTAAYTSS